MAWGRLRWQTWIKTWTWRRLHWLYRAMDIKTPSLNGSRHGPQDFSIEWIKTWTLPKHLVCLGLSKPFPKPPKLWLNREWQDATSGFRCSFCVFSARSWDGGWCHSPPASHASWSPGAGREGWGASLAPYNLPKRGGSLCFFLFWWIFRPQSQLCLHKEEIYAIGDNRIINNL